jgi:hypothetical protein
MGGGDDGSAIFHHRERGDRRENAAGQRVHGGPKNHQCIIRGDISRDILSAISALSVVKKWRGKIQPIIASHGNQGELFRGKNTRSSKKPSAALMPAGS